MAAQAPPKLLTVDQVADRLQVSKWSVYRRVAAGELPAVKLGDGPRAPIRIDLGELVAWLYSEGTTHEGTD
jgi:excisionase family DNA binding protein